MNADKKNQFNERMEALHKKYREQLPEKYQEIENGWKDCQSNLSDPAAVETFYRLIHTFKGTAATFGFIKQSEITFEIQKIFVNDENDIPALDKNDFEKIQNYLDELKTNINTPAQSIEN